MPPVTGPLAGTRRASAAPCTLRRSGAKAVPSSARSTSPSRALAPGPSTRTKTRSKSESVCVVPSGTMGVSESVSAPWTVTPGATSPLMSSRSPEVSDTSRLLPATTPRVTDPDVMMPLAPEAGVPLGRRPLAPRGIGLVGLHEDGQAGRRGDGREAAVRDDERRRGVERRAEAERARGEVEEVRARVEHGGFGGEDLHADRARRDGRPKLDERGARLEHDRVAHGAQPRPLGDLLRRGRRCPQHRQRQRHAAPETHGRRTTDDEPRGMSPEAGESSEAAGHAVRVGREESGTARARCGGGGRENVAGRAGVFKALGSASGGGTRPSAVSACDVSANSTPS